jgi:hypothetical protein
MLTHVCYLTFPTEADTFPTAAPCSSVNLSSVAYMCKQYQPIVSLQAYTAVSDLHRPNHFTRPRRTIRITYKHAHTPRIPSDFLSLSKVYLPCMHSPPLHCEIHLQSTRFVVFPTVLRFSLYSTSPEHFALQPPLILCLYDLKTIWACVARAL